MKTAVLIIICFVQLTLLGASSYFPDLKNTTPPHADSNKMKVYVDSLCTKGVYRNWTNTTELNRAGNYIFAEFSKHNHRVSKQTFSDNRKEYFNVISSFGPDNAPRLIIGAHYDVCGNQQGADDNASGVSSILEISRLFSQLNQTLEIRVDLVAYTLEEPPFFRDFMMGSAVHARSLKEENANILGMISVEMIGYYSSERGSQGYPAKIMKLFYPGKANYISLVTKFGGGNLLKRVKKGMKSQKDVPVRTIKGPITIPGIDYSDHLNYWKHGFSALMITDTSFYRNSNYHEVSDIPNTLNYSKMAFVTDGIFQFILDLNKKHF